MRGTFLVFVAAALITAGVFASSAFNDANVAQRSLAINVVGDASAYVKLAGNGAHSCFVQQDATTGKISFAFGATTGCSSAGVGTGVNAGGGTKFSRYSFHDVLKVTNAGQKTVLVWVNASTSTAGANWVNVAKKATSGSMAEADYYNTSSASISLASTGSLYVGIRINATLSAGNAAWGNVTVQARAS